MPRVAISVDMLDTGVDIPSIQNLVFAKPVFSYVKFWQMIGRGTRLWENKATGEKKDSFLIIDHWNNFAYFNVKPEGEITSITEPLPVRLFRIRLAKLDRLRTSGSTKDISEAISQLQDMLGQIPVDNVNVRPHLAELTELQAIENWLTATAQFSEHISKAIAPLLRFVSDLNLQVLIFELRTEQLAVSYLTQHSEEIGKLRKQIVEDLKLLPINLPQVSAQATRLAWMTSAGFWEHLDYERIMELQYTFAPLMRYRQSQRRDIIKLNLPDRIVSRRWIIYGPSGEGAFAESYREQVEAQVRRLADELPALDKLRRGEELEEVDLQALSDALNGPDLFVTENKLQEVYERPDANLLAFMRHILGINELQSKHEHITKLFDEFIHAHSHFTATQINFLRTVRAAVMQGAKLQEGDLRQLPFSRIGDVQTLFTKDEQGEILTLANKSVA
jgi:type I restriction enzyme R subunit